MIRVVHKQEPPELGRERRRRLAKLRQAWVALDPSDDEAVERFLTTHDNALNVGYRVAWSALYLQWYGRCAYCGAHLRWTDPIDHFRPRRPRPSHHPGYWWLTWTWTNLLPACHDCNSAKDNQFPVEGERLGVWEKEVAGERAQLINPSREDPGDELEYFCESFQGRERWTVQARRSKGRGATTIRVLGLDKDDERYTLHLRMLHELLVDLQAARAEGPERLRKLWARKVVRNLLATEPGQIAQPFPALTRAYLDRHFRDAIEAHGLELPQLGEPAPLMVAGPKPPPPTGSRARLDAELRRDLDALSRRPPEQETQRLLVALVARGDWTLSELAELFPQTPATLKTHLRKLAKQGRLTFEGEVATRK